jgi:hypothetical protein
MIVVLARPRVYRPQPDGDLAPGGLGVEVALTLGAAGTPVELVGSIGDDPEGDRVVVELGRAHVGHAALLRDPSVRTPRLGDADLARALPRLEAADVELGLRYVADCRVLVIAEDLDAPARQQALEAGAYHGAAIIIVASPDSVDPAALPDDVTLLERPSLAMSDDDDEEADVPADARDVAAQEAAFARLVADYASQLAQGATPEAAFRSALEREAWEAAPD